MSCGHLTDKNAYCLWHTFSDIPCNQLAQLLTFYMTCLPYIYITIEINIAILFGKFGRGKNILEDPYSVRFREPNQLALLFGPESLRPFFVIVR